MFSKTWYDPSLEARKMRHNTVRRFLHASATPMGMDELEKSCRLLMSRRFPPSTRFAGSFEKRDPKNQSDLFFFFFGAVLFVLGFRVWWKWKRSLFRPGSRKVGIGVVAEPFAKWDPRIKIRMFFLLQFSSF